MMPRNVRNWIGGVLRKAADHVDPPQKRSPERTKIAQKRQPQLNWDIPPDEQRYVLMHYKQRDIRQVAIFSDLPTNEQITRFCHQRELYGSFCLFSMRPRRKCVMKLKVLPEIPFWEMPWDLQKERLGLDDNRLEGQSVDNAFDFTDGSTNDCPKVRTTGEGRKESRV
jgi:hypothetical protein